MLVVIPMEAVTVEVAYALWILNLYPDIPALQSKTLTSTVSTVCVYDTYRIPGNDVHASMYTG